MLCHDVLCYAGLELNNGKCKVKAKYSTQENGCYSVGLLLTVTKGAKHLTQGLLNEDPWLKMDIEATFKSITDLYKLKPSCLYFYHFNSSGFLDYIYVYVTFFFQYYVEKFLAVQFVIQLKIYEFIHEVRRPATFNIQPVLYNITFSNVTQTWVTAVVDVHVPLKDFGERIDTLSGNFSISTSPIEQCFGNWTRSFTKALLCPYIQISDTMMPMKIENGYLFLYDLETQSNLLKVFSNWEYGSVNGTISLCLEDYLSLYHSFQSQPEAILYNVSPSYYVAAKANRVQKLFLLLGLMYIL